MVQQIRKPVIRELNCQILTWRYDLASPNGGRIARASKENWRLRKST